MPNSKKQVFLSWSSGKDSAWTLHVLKQDPDIDVIGLLTTVNTNFDRVAMHSVRRTILEEQARAVGLELLIVPLPWPCSNELYESAMIKAVNEIESRGIGHMAFGDLFLEDVRAYREKQLATTKLKPLFPLWGKPTPALSREMVNSGIEAVVTCIDSKKLPPSFAGRDYNRKFLDDLPDEIDPCGENGEFHTCVLNSPDFQAPVSARRGEIVERDGFVFADLLP